VRIEPFLDLLDNVHKSGAEWRARCPVHEKATDGKDLAVREGDTAILVKCHAGCTTQTIVKTLGLDMFNLFYDERGGFSDEEPESVYEYTDARGTPIFEVVRFPGKRFSQRLSGSSEWGLQGLEKKPLFHLPEVIEAIVSERAIYIVEGEKDVLAIQRAGGVATCCAGGAGKWHPDYSRQLQGAKKIYIIADKDEKGYEHADQVSRMLGDIPHEIMQAKQGKDAFDHLNSGGTLQRGDQPFVPAPKSFYGVSFYTADTVEPTGVRWIPGWEGFFPFSALAHVAGMPGVNKSTLTCKVAADVTKLGKGVLFITSEDSYEAVVVPRLIAAGADLSRVHLPRKFYSFPRDVEGLHSNIEEYDVGLVIVDPIDAHLDHDVDSHRNQSIRSALAPLAFVADLTHCCIVMIGHPNKDRNTRDPMMRVGGSIGIPGISRSAMLMGIAPDTPEEGGMRVLSRYKGNWGGMPEALLFRVETHPVGDELAVKLSSAGKAHIPAWKLLPRGPTEKKEE